MNLIDNTSASFRHAPSTSSLCFVPRCVKMVQFNIIEITKNLRSILEGRMQSSAYFFILALLSLLVSLPLIVNGGNAFTWQISLQRRHNERVGVSNHLPRDCLLNRLFKAQIKENIKAPRHWPLWGEFTGDPWIPRTKGQLRGKCFHLMTSSCIVGDYNMTVWILVGNYISFTIAAGLIRLHMPGVKKSRV